MGMGSNVTPGNMATRGGGADMGGGVVVLTYLVPEAANYVSPDDDFGGGGRFHRVTKLMTYGFW